MDAKKEKNDENHQSKRQKTTHDKMEIVDGTNAIVASASNNNESRPKIFKLNADCCELVFEWLSLENLLSLRSTCKRMKLVVDYYIKLNYCKVRRSNISGRLHLMEITQMKLKCFEWIKYLRISMTELNQTDIDGIKYVLNQLEALKFDEVKVNGDFYETVLKHCPQLKYLGLSMEKMSQKIIGTGNKWLLCRYPTLEHFHIRTYTSRGKWACELLAFFVLNTNIRIFSASSAFLLTCYQIFLRLHINFDRLDIFFRRDLKLVSSMVKELHAYQFYRRLHLYSDICEQDTLPWDDTEYLWTLPNLEKLDFDSLPDDYPIRNPVESIKVFSAYEGCPTDLSGELAAQQFINLRRIDIKKIHYLSEFRLFVSRALNLKEIRVWEISKPKIRHLIALNEYRERLANARKIVMYVDEKTYFEVKWNSQLKLSMIELRLIESCEMNHLFQFTEFMR